MKNPRVIWEETRDEDKALIFRRFNRRNRSAFARGNARADDQGNLRRLSAEFQNSTSAGGSGEIFTSEAAGPNGTGGTPVYQKNLRVPDDVDVLYVTFSAQADVHNGSALLMNATVDEALCEPLAGQTQTGGGGPHVQTGWYTLLILPEPGMNRNCNDGEGGPADCHDNAINFSCCARLSKGHRKILPVDIKLANLPGGEGNISFYERSTIYIDGQKDEKRQFCVGVGTDQHE
jgi:hypothetical protein